MWEYLITAVQSYDIKQSILSEGFMLGRNPVILPGIYAQPNHSFKCIGRKEKILIWTAQEAVCFETGAEEALGLANGHGSLEWNRLYIETMNSIGINLHGAAEQPLDKEWQDKNSKIIDQFLENREQRIEYAKKLAEVFRSKGVDILLNSWEVIVLNPDVIIRME